MTVKTKIQPIFGRNENFVSYIFFQYQISDQRGQTFNLSYH